MRRNLGPSFQVNAPGFDIQLSLEVVGVARLRGREHTLYINPLVKNRLDQVSIDNHMAIGFRAIIKNVMSMLQGACGW